MEPLLAAAALHKNGQVPRVPIMPRRKATMLDSSGDGIADLLLLDSTGDGVADQPVSSVAVDTTGDGRPDALREQRNADCKPGTSPSWRPDRDTFGRRRERSARSAGSVRPGASRVRPLHAP